MNPVTGIAMAAAMLGAVAGGGLTVGAQALLASRPAVEVPTVQAAAPIDLTDNTWRLRRTVSNGPDLTDNTWRLRTTGSSGQDGKENSWHVRARNR